ncbi:MAG: hypothetical protein Q8L48_05660 [Archangium sp.]|nr:hypothetical protein [Archangium sp.]
MPTALKIFLWSLIAGLAGGYVGMHVCFWVAQHWFPREPMAGIVAVLLTGAIGVASAVTAGVLMGKRAR